MGAWEILGVVYVAIGVFCAQLVAFRVRINFLTWLLTALLWAFWVPHALKKIQEKEKQDEAR